MSNEFPFKIETLLEQCGGNRSIGRVILDEFLVQIVVDTQEIATCLANGHLTQAGKIGHRLKGTASVLGAEKLHALCAGIETAGINEQTEELTQLCNELKTEADRCAAAVPDARTRL